MNKYKFHWLDGKVDESTGDSPADALSRLGYSQGAVAALDYYETSWDHPKPEDIMRDLRQRFGGLVLLVLQQDWEGARDMASQVKLTFDDGIQAHLPEEK